MKKYFFWDAIVLTHEKTNMKSSVFSRFDAFIALKNGEDM